MTRFVLVCDNEHSAFERAAGLVGLAIRLEQQGRSMNRPKAFTDYWISKYVI